MTKEDKELLLKDLSARLPYGVKCSYSSCFEREIGTIVQISKEGFVTIIDTPEVIPHYIRDRKIESIEPYLFPLSSMTDEQKAELWQIRRCHQEILTGPNTIDWLNAHHFDYRELIKKGLAIDATGLNIY